MPGMRYSATDQQTLASTADTALTISANASTAHRLWLTEFIIGNVGTPADLVSVYTVGNTSDVGTGDALTEVPLDPGDAASRAVATGNHTSEPTYTNDILDIPLNHRATFRWVAAPGNELVNDGTVNDGFGIKTDHASATTDYLATMIWLE